MLLCIDVMNGSHKLIKTAALGLSTGVRWHALICVCALLLQRAWLTALDEPTAWSGLQPSSRHSARFPDGLVAAHRQVRQVHRTTHWLLRPTGHNVLAGGRKAVFFMRDFARRHRVSLAWMRHTPQMYSSRLHVAVSQSSALTQCYNHC